MKKIVRAMLTIFLITILIPLVCSTRSSANSISIDGYFDDWEDIPCTDVYYNDFNSEQWHKGAFIIAEGYLYVYINLAPAYNSQIPVGGYNICIDGKSCVANINYSDSNGNIDYSQGGKLSNLKNGINDNLNVFIGYWPIYNVGKAAIKIVKGNSKHSTNDQLEFAIDISQLEEILNLPANSIENGSKVEIENPQLGSQKITSVGTSTGTYLGIATSVLATILLGVLLKKRNRNYESVRSN